MKHNALAALSLTLLLGAGLSCDNATGLPRTGGITITLLSDATGAPISVRIGDREPDAVASHELVPVEGGASANITLSGVRVTVSGPTNKTVTSQSAAGGFFDVSVDGLSPGSYSVTVEGLVGTEVAHFGQTSGVGVTAGASTPATITFPLFEPVISPSATPDTTDVLHFTVTYGAVQNATGYIVQWSKSPSMANAQSKPVTGTSTDITVADEGNYYVAVKAVNATVSSGGKSSAIQVVYAFQGVATVTVTPATPSIGYGTTQQLQADAKDADNNTVANVTWFWSSDKPSVATVSQSGLVTGVAGGTATITAVGKGMPGGTTVTVGAQLATKLGFSIQPANSVAGDPLSPAVQVEIQDAAGNRVTNARDAVTIAFGANPGTGTLTGTKTVNAIDGIASFTGLWVNKAAANYTLGATSGSLTPATSAQFTISPAAPAKLSFTQQPANKEANTSLAAVTVTIADLFDNTTTATNNVTVSLGQNFYKNFAAAGGTLAGTQTVAAVNGVATFGTLRVDKPSPAYTLLASATGLTATSSNPFNINLTISQMGPSRFGLHTCAVATGGPYCWGNNGNGQLGALTGGITTDSVPALVRGGLAFTQMTAGSIHSCGITSANDAYCWGFNGSGQLGDGTNTQRTQPVAVIGGHKFAQISAGESFTCGLTTANGANVNEDRQIWCWGNNADGEMGTGASGPSVSTPLRITTDPTTFKYSFVSSGGFHACGLLRNDVVAGIASKLVCWGYDAYGQVGAGSIGTIRGLFFVTGTQLWASVSTGFYHTCAVTTTVAAGNGFCWGRDDEGELGDDITLAAKPAPTVVSGGATWGSIKAGGFHSCGLTTTNTAFCWGYNQYGQLGNGTSTFNAGTNQNQAVPVQAGLGFTFSVLEAGQYHSCGLSGTNMFCWGRGANGQLGGGDRQQVKETPTQIIQ